MFGTCWTCGGAHFQRDCPQGNHAQDGKGKGALQKGKGKGADEVRIEEGFWHAAESNQWQQEEIGASSGSIDQIQPAWNVVAKRARSAKDLRPVHKGTFLGEVTRNSDRQINEITDQSGRWERLPIKIDSGAIDTVIPPSVATYFPLQETESSKSGSGFRAANGTHIAHHGQRRIVGLGDQWNQMGITAQVAEVKTPLGSVHQMINAGNAVHLEKGNCYLQNLRTGSKIRIEERNGTFELGMWVPKNNKVVQQVQVMNQVGNVVSSSMWNQNTMNAKIAVSNRFNALSERDEDGRNQGCDMSHNLSGFSGLEGMY